ncbi:MAG: glycosyltransferase family 25 protein [Planctomycetes bacterium]|nr:glycosyltransferase family 25 protein [Planctomycetota bacterium]
MRIPERLFVINLAFKTDRLDKFQASIPPSLGSIDVWRAVHGDTVQHPDWWTAGRGAWGCYRSHMQILEKCYNEGVESYLVFEDDAVFREGFEDLYWQFLESLPDDWEMAYLGGQLLHEVAHPPQPVNAHCYIPYNVNRTHAFAVHKRGYHKLYRHLSTTPFVNGEHIDHHLGRLHESGRLKVYCPGKWLVGQDAGPSNISGNVNSISFWVDPERLSNPAWMVEKPKTIYLEAPKEVAAELRLRGWHQGYWRNEHELDRGVCAAVASGSPESSLARWYQFVASECVRSGHKGVCLYHPSLTWDVVRQFGFASFTRIRAATLAEAEAALAEFDKLPEQPTPEPRDEPAGVPEARTEGCLTNSTKRHLCYHIWPDREGTWRRNVAQLLQRIDQFDGVRSIGVVTDAESETLSAVQSAFAGHRINHWVTFPNNADLGQAVTFAPLLQTVSRESGVTFYGHANGVTSSSGARVDRLEEILYQANLGDPEQILTNLETHPITGAFKLPINVTGDGGAYQYLGSFFWFRNSDVFGQRAWHEIPASQRAVEIWPGRLFSGDQSGALFAHTTEALDVDSVWDLIQSKFTAC